jgi:hypothetical protein
MWLFLACWSASTPAVPVETAPVAFAPLPTPSRFLVTDSVLFVSFDADELGRSLCQGDARVRGAWLRDVRAAVGGGLSATDAAEVFGTLTVGCKSPEFCAWARGLATDPSVGSAAATLALACSEPEDLGVLSRELRASVIADDLPRIRGLVAFVAWQRDPSWVRELVREVMPAAKSDYARDALAMALAGSGDTASATALMQACDRRSAEGTEAARREYAACDWYADALAGGSLLPGEDDPRWVRYLPADPVSYVARHPAERDRISADLSRCVDDGVAGLEDPVVLEACVRRWMGVNRAAAAARAPALDAVADAPDGLARLADELATFPSIAERDAAFAAIGLPPSAAPTIPDALASERRLVDLSVANHCREQIDGLLSLAPSEAARRWGLTPGATTWIVDTWEDAGRWRAYARDENGRCDARALAAIVNAALVRTTNSDRITFLYGNRDLPVALPAQAIPGPNWLGLALPTAPTSSDRPE